MRTGLIVVLVSLMAQGAGAGGCGAKRNDNPATVNQTTNVNVPAKPTPGGVEEPLNDEIKELAGGAYGKISDTFVAVARNSETYAVLRELVGNLPQLDAGFFSKNMVVAAFMGQRNTGGYSVQITRASGNRLLVSSKSPGAGSMTTQALTAPFKIVSVAVSDDRPLAIEIEAAWKNEMRPYRLTGGEFSTGGGFAGRFEKLQLAGELRASRLGKLATFVFDLKSTGGAKARTLQDAATGIVGDGGSISGAIVDAGTLVDMPRSALGVKGSFGENEDKISLTFESLPSNVADGYSGQGRLDAAATAPAPPKRHASDDDPM